MSTDVNRPDAHTSNYGWAIWHASQACRVGGLDAIAEAQLATARALLAQIDNQDDYVPDLTLWEATDDH